MLIGEQEKRFAENMAMEAAHGKKIYIWGTGITAQHIFQLLNENHVTITAWIETTPKRKTVLGQKVLDAKVLSSLKEAIVIVGVNTLKSEAEIRNFIHDLSINPDVCFIWQKDFLPNEYDFSDKRLFEFTTTMGCGINCRFCPQEKLLTQYYKNDKTRTKRMSLDTVQRCIKKMPADSHIVFSGFAEPFLNPECMEMIQLVEEHQLHYLLFTTFVGGNKDIVEKLTTMKYLDYVTFHAADSKNYAKIPLTKEYYELVEQALSSKKKNGAPLIDKINGQAELDRKILDLCQDKYMIEINLHDRAGNLTDEELSSRKVPVNLIGGGV